MTAGGVSPLSEHQQGSAESNIKQKQRNTPTTSLRLITSDSRRKVSSPLVSRAPIQPPLCGL